MSRFALIASLVLALTPAALGQGDAPRWDRKRQKELEELGARFWKARPKNYFQEWDAAARTALLAEADQLGELPAGRLDDVVALLWKSAKKYGPAFDKKGGKSVIRTPYGDAWCYVKGSGRGKGLVLGLHGGGEGAGSADEPAGTWRAAKCIGMYPQGIQLVHDTWNTVHGERFLLSLIEIAKVQYEVDPDRVYSMGFSMGGTGSWFMAGRHPDLLAGASPCAGVLMAEPKSQVPRKEDVRQIQHGIVPNVRNLAMWYYIGTADRNCMPGTYLFVDDMLKELRADDPGGYERIHFKLYEGLAHAYPPKEPATGMKWIGEQTRDAFPETVVWEYATHPFPLPNEQDRVSRYQKKTFYWLACDDPVDRQLVRATRSGNRFELEVDSRPGGVEGLSLWLNDRMVSADEDVVVVHRGREVYRGRPRRSYRTVLETLDARVDRTLVFDRRVDL